MDLMVTPGQMARRAEFYFQLGQLTSAGMGIVSALRQLMTHPVARSYRLPVGALLEQLDHGLTLAESARRVDGWLPELDLALIQAGELSGRLDSSFRTLAGYYEERARMGRQLLGDLAYPVFLFHFAVFLLPFASFFTTGNLAAYLRSTLGILLPCYAVAALLIFAAQGTHQEAWRSVWEQVLDRVPILGRARRELTLSRLASALEALLSAGVSIVEAWGLAASACGSPAMKREVASWRPLLEGGQTPSELVTESGRFPELFAGQYAAGELSGTLEEQLGRLERYYRESGMRTLRAMSTWLPRVFYIGIVLMIAWRVLAFWSGYFQGVSNAIGM